MNHPHLAANKSVITTMAAHDDGATILKAQQRLLMTLEPFLKRTDKSTRTAGVFLGQETDALR